MLNVSSDVLVVSLLLLMLINGLLVGYRIGYDCGYRQRNDYDQDLPSRK